MTHVTCRLTVRNWDQLRNPALGNRVSMTFNFYTIIISYTHGTVFVRIVASRIFCSRILHVIVTLVTKAPRKVGHLPPGQTPTAPWISAPDNRPLRGRLSGGRCPFTGAQCGTRQRGITPPPTRLFTNGIRHACVYSRSSRIIIDSTLDKSFFDRIYYETRAQRRPEV